MMRCIQHHHAPQAATAARRRVSTHRCRGPGSSPPSSERRPTAAAQADRGHIETTYRRIGRSVQEMDRGSHRHLNAAERRAACIDVDSVGTGWATAKLGGAGHGRDSQWRQVTDRLRRRRTPPGWTSLLCRHDVTGQKNANQTLMITVTIYSESWKLETARVSLESESPPTESRRKRCAIRHVLHISGLVHLLRAPRLTRRTPLTSHGNYWTISETTRGATLP